MQQMVDGDEAARAGPKAISAAPEGGAALAAIDGSSRQVRSADRVVVLFNTGGALKYLAGLKACPTAGSERRTIERPNVTQAVGPGL